MIELTDTKKQDVMEPLLNGSTFEELECDPTVPGGEKWVEPDILSR